MLCQLQVYSKVIQLHVHTDPRFFRFLWGGNFQFLKHMRGRETSLFHSPIHVAIQLFLNEVKMSTKGDQTTSYKTGGSFQRIFQAEVQAFPHK